ncbi:MULTISPECIES: helix-turn-helix domain-containing protein [Pseudomonas]|uniref:Helix-turn-helix n=1 Tax=Pseudomonas lutea TaxID=243924 RepID=A0A9X8MH53_9PSED|nr:MULTISPECIES: helix-turn-helix transcriptional regulator [Pseudomonas]SER37196.1 Helix-turn-helix [Pseudomonas lutea]
MDTGTVEIDIQVNLQQIGPRITAARRAAGLNQIHVAVAVGQKNPTQVSLWESGERLPKMEDMIAMSKLFAVPLDYLVGLSDDPLADPTENNQAFLMRMIATSIADAHKSWADGLSEQVAITLQGQSQDRSDIQKMAVILKDFCKAFARIKELNPGFVDDMRGSDNVQTAVNRMTEVITQADERIARERKRCEIIDKELGLATGDYDRRMRTSVTQNVRQMVLEMPTLDFA